MTGDKPCASGPCGDGGAVGASLSVLSEADGECCDAGTAELAGGEGVARAAAQAGAAGSTSECCVMRGRLEGTGGGPMDVRRRLATARAA